MRKLLTLSTCLLLSATAVAQNNVMTSHINILPLYQEDPTDANAGTIVLPRLRLKGEESGLLGGKIHLNFSNGTFSISDSSPMTRTTMPTIDEGFDPTAATALDNILAKVQQRIDDGFLPGMVIRVEIDGKSWRATVGNARMSTQTKRVYDDHFRIGSISKVFTSTALLLLYQEGRVGLDDTMEQWFSNEPWYSQMPNGDKITVRHLLRHQSGLYNYVRLESVQNGMLNERTKHYSPEDLLALSFANPVDFDEPGSEVKYSNIGAILIGLLIEKITGESAEKVIRDTVFEPLGLFHTMFGSDPGMPYYYTHGYIDGDTTTPDVVEWTNSTFLDPSVAWTSGAIISNIDDLHTGIKCQLSRSPSCPTQLLSEETLAEKLDYVPTVLDGFNVKFGLGVLNVCNFHYHPGGIQGYEALAFYHPNVPNYGEVMISLSLNRYPTPDAYNGAATILDIIFALFPEQCSGLMSQPADDNTSTTAEARSAKTIRNLARTISNMSGF